ncbi:OmpA family protein [Lacihabitans sp. LS3-19]|uniref:OmpA family protein n=1 Tax=Lacihabitans sp. LS3-19 TaxID=2487335 RepID=UPI0020CD99FA|nr:OmpA family protein [Lacihabitans sp. LS3-19]MCP9766925.1 OmpA family protein [Lacihabitans sp. LS3-19]
MKQVLIILFFLVNLGVNAQVTSNPKIKKKSTKDVFINKIEITDDQTVFSMQFVAKTPKETIKEYLEGNPEDKEQLQNMDPFMRNLYLQQMMQQIGNSTISFQPNSYLRTSDGKKYKFLKATDIPVAPNRKDVEGGKKYFFKVYFEKLPKGYEFIDLIEHDSDKEDSFTFWNFFGISINNPDGKSKTLAAKPKIEEEVLSEDFRLYGKVIDAITNKPIAAKIICLNLKNNEVIDSVRTSKSGSYEFLVNNNEVLYKISSEGYENMEESFNVGAFLSKGSFEKDIYVEPISNEKVVEEETAEEKIPEPLEESSKIGVLVDKESDSFKLDKVYFDLGDSRVLPESFEQLDKLVEYLSENEEYKIQIEGHTDNQGDSKANKKLSLERAYNVREYLVGKGIDGKRIKFVGMGDMHPVASNDDEESRKLNRRVEYKLIK